MTKIKKVLILGIDAIEYELVEQWKLSNLQQKEYGKTILPIKKEEGFRYDLPATVIIWSSFITGKTPKDHKIQTFKIWNSTLLNWCETNLINRIIKPVQFDHEKLEKREKQQKYFNIIKKIPNSIGFKKHNPIRNDIKTTTLFDNPKSIPLHVPVYNSDAFPEYKKKIFNAIENKNYKHIFELQCKQEFDIRTKEVFEWLERKEEWNVLMQYFYLLDGIQHVFYNNPKKIAKYYLMFDEFVGKVRQKIDDETLLIIVSDHGQKKGIHTSYGFYSSSNKLRLKKPKLIDFRWKIETLLFGEKT